MKAFYKRRRKVNLYQLVVWPEDAGYLKYIGWSNSIQSFEYVDYWKVYKLFWNWTELLSNWHWLQCNILIDFSWWPIMKTLSKKTICLMESCCKRLINLAFIPNFDLSQKVTVTKLVWYSFIELIQGNWEAYIYEPGQICWSRHSQLLSKGLIDVVLANSNLQQ